MTARNTIHANLTHGNPDRPGLTFSGNRINDMVCRGLSGSEDYQQKRWTEGNFEYYDDEWGNIWYAVRSNNRRGEIFRPAIRDWAQLDSLRLPDYDSPRRYLAAAEAFSKTPDKFKLAFVPGWVFATSRYLRKMEIYFMDLVEYREELDRLHTIVTDQLVKVIHRFADCGAEGIFYCEDLGTQDRLLLSPKMWREVFKPHYEKLTGAAHERGMKVLMHSCGYNWELLDDLIAAGIDCFQFDQPAVYDMPALAEKLRRHKVSLWAPVDIQKVLPTGNREFIESEAEKMVRLFEGFLILKDYGDLVGIGVKPEWDMWAYNAILRAAGLEPEKA